MNLLVQYSGIPSRGWWFGRWQGFQKPLSATVPLIPDGYFEIGSQQGFRPAFVEVDLGTEAVPVLAKKANQYLQLAASGEFAQLFGRSQFRVLIITTSKPNAFPSLSTGCIGRETARQAIADPELAQALEL